MAKIKNKIDVGHDVVDDMIWMSYRYCIGRRTIAAHHHAGSLATFLFTNREVIGEDRLEFYAKDIIDCINTQLRFCDNVRVDDLNTDVFAAVMPYYSDVTKQEEGCEIDHIVYEVHSDGVGTRVASGPIQCSFRDLVTDLLPWYKLAQALKSNKRIVVDYEGKLSEEIGFGWPDGAGGMKYNSTENYFEAPFSDAWIDGQYIKEAKDVH